MRDLPAVRGLRDDVAAEVDVLLLNIHEGVGSRMLERFGFRTSPLYLIFDMDGEEVLRSSHLPTQATLLETVQNAK